MKVAALDLGTNTFLCLIAEVNEGRITRVDHDQVEMVRLGQDVQKTKRFHAEALARAKVALQKFKKVIDQHRPERVLAMATSAARDVTNAEDLFQICRELSIPMQIIPGGKEALITFQGAISGRPKQPSPFNQMVIDVGGGSTEYIYGRDAKMVWGQSLNIGCVRLKERFIQQFPVSDDISDLLRIEIRQQLETLGVIGMPSAHNEIQEILAVAGTPTELARIDVGGFDVEKIEGYRLTRDRLGRWIQDLKVRNPEQVQMDFGVNPGRADVLLVGVMILAESLDFWRQDELIVSTRGVRYGVALEVARDAN